MCSVVMHDKQQTYWVELSSLQEFGFCRWQISTLWLWCMWQERSAGDVRHYNDIIRHETLRVAVCDMLEGVTSCPESLRYRYSFSALLAYPQENDQCGWILWQILLAGCISRLISGLAEFTWKELFLTENCANFSLNQSHTAFRNRGGQFCMSNCIIV